MVIPAGRLYPGRSRCRPGAVPRALLRAGASTFRQCAPDFSPEISNLRPAVPFAASSPAAELCHLDVFAAARSACARGFLFGARGGAESLLVFYLDVECSRTIKFASRVNSCGEFRGAGWGSSVRRLEGVAFSFRLVGGSKEVESFRRFLVNPG